MPHKDGRPGPGSPLRGGPLSRGHPTPSGSAVHICSTEEPVLRVPLQCLVGDGHSCSQGASHVLSRAWRNVDGLPRPLRPHGGRAAAGMRHALFSLQGSRPWPLQRPVCGSAGKGRRVSVSFRGALRRQPLAGPLLQRGCWSFCGSVAVARHEAGGLGNCPPRPRARIPAGIPLLMCPLHAGWEAQQHRAGPAHH